MTVQESTDYDKLKQKVLKAYELVPDEAYRQEFRISSKSTDVTHVEFAHEIEQLLDKWVVSKGIDGDFDKFRHLLLVD